MDSSAQLSAPPAELETRRPPALLPPALTGPAAFLWLWALPIAVLLLLNVQGYWLIEGNMDSGQRKGALVLGLSGLADFLAGVAFFVFSERRSSRLQPSVVSQYGPGVSAIVVQVAYLWLAFVSADQSVLPASVTMWIYPSERFLFNQFAFGMLPLFLGILRLACAKPARDKGAIAAVAINLGMAVAAPVLLYSFVQVGRVFDRFDAIRAFVFAAVFVVLGLMMFVGIVRALMLALRAVQTRHVAGERILIVVVGLVLPVAGLLLNRTIPFPVDFQAWEVYALVVANFAILLTASWQHEKRPRTSFYLLCGTFPFALYFFVVLLPYTPLSIVAIIVMGAGFLVLTPTFLFTLHLHLLNKARRNVGSGREQRRVAFIGFACCLLLPGFFVVRGLADRMALHAALDYVYAPSISAGNLSYPASVTDLRRALRNHRNYKNGIYYPFLSDFYAWQVFDNLILPDEKLAQLEKVFLGAAGSKRSVDPVRRQMDFFGRSSVRERAHMPRSAPPPRTVEVRNLQARSAVMSGENSGVTLVLTLQNTSTVQAEYRETLPLPPGVFASGFRLHINGQPVPGRIFEKKTALWVYAMIRDSERRDPGLLVYNKPGELELRVFPVGANASATVEVDFLLPNGVVPPDIGLDSGAPAIFLGELGHRLRPQLVFDERGAVVAGDIAAAPVSLAEQEPYFHVIVDRSRDNGFEGDISAALRTLKNRFPAARLARVTAANYEVTDLAAQLTPIDELARRMISKSSGTLSGGFALDLALAHAIRQHRDRDLDAAASAGSIPPRPVFVILSRTAVVRTLALEISEQWCDLLAGLEIHELGADGSFVTQRKDELAPAPILRLGNSVRPFGSNHLARFKPRAGEGRLEYWSATSADWRPVAEIVRQENNTPWSRAVSLHLQEQDYRRSPGDSTVGMKALVSASRASGILLPETSYIVVENSAQWRMLELSERQKLNQNAALDLLETPAPPALILVLGFVLWIALRAWWARGRAGGGKPFNLSTA